MANLIFSIESVKLDEVGKLNPNWEIDLGVTKGGGSFTQDVTSLEIMSDQASDPEAIIATQATKTITLNLLDATPSNLALAFGGSVDTTDANEEKVTIPSLVTGVEKQVKIKTRKVNNIQYEIKIPRALIKGNSTITFSNDDASSIPIEITVLTPASGNPVTITKL